MGHRRYKCAAGFYVAVLVGGLRFAGDVGHAVAFVFFGNDAGAGNYVFLVRHAVEAHAEFAQSGRAGIITEHLSDEAHDEHSVRDDAAGADQFADFGVGMQRVEVSGRARVAHQLQVCYRGLHQLRNLVANLDIFVIQLCGSLGVTGHWAILLFLYSRTTMTWRAFSTGAPCWFVYCTSVVMMSIEDPDDPWRVLPSTMVKMPVSVSPGWMGARYSYSSSPCKMRMTLMPALTSWPTILRLPQKVKVVGVMRILYGEEEYEYLAPIH